VIVIAVADTPTPLGVKKSGHARDQRARLTGDPGERVPNTELKNPEHQTNSAAEI
jgi:hypothetical protein